MPIRTKDPLGALRGTTAGVLTAVLVTLLLAGCSSSTSKAGGTTSPRTPSTSTAATTASAADDQAAVKALYLKFLDLSIPVAQKVDLLQDGAAFQPAMTALAANPAAKNISLQVSKVDITSPNLATVTYSLLLSGSPVLPNTTGYAVREDGHWKIAGQTFCGLVAAQPGATLPDACSTPAGTALPTS